MTSRLAEKMVGRGLFFDRQQPTAFGFVIPPVFAEVIKGITMIGAEPGIVEIDSLGGDFFDDGVMVLFMAGDPISNQNQAFF